MHRIILGNSAGDISGINNSWDSWYPSGGNYWSNYSGTDAKNDGIGDKPYDISGVQDRYPFMQQNGWISSVPEPTPAVSPAPTLPPEVAPWDADHDNIIQKNEAVAAVVDYFAGSTTKANALAVVMVYFRRG